MTPTFTRRRVIAITAAVAGLPLLPAGARAKAAAQMVTWRGLALGAAATMRIHHPDRASAERLVELSVREVRRLERMFSLYRDDSLLVVLNRRGALAAPPTEFVQLLRACRRHAQATDGAFDPTVQPLWRLYADHFARPDADPDGPPAGAVAAALAKVGLDRVQVGEDLVAFAARGMALTLNGIAQGFVTDRVVALLRAEGIDHSLVDIGEARALGTRPDGGAWQVGILDPAHPDRVGEFVPVVDQAVATSGGYGFRFDARGRFHHLFDPRTGRSPARYRSVTVVMPEATAADALSTAFCAMPPDAVQAALTAAGAGRALLTTSDGRRLALTA